MQEHHHLHYAVLETNEEVTNMAYISYTAMQSINILCDGVATVF